MLVSLKRSSVFFMKLVGSTRSAPRLALSAA